MNPPQPPRPASRLTVVVGVLLFLASAVAVWLLMPPRPRAVLPPGEVIGLSPTGLLATQHAGRVILWDTAAGHSTGHLPGDLRAHFRSEFVFSPCGRWLSG